MPTLTGAIILGGAFIDAKLMQSPNYVAALKKENRQFSTPRIIRAKIDTGASNTCVDAHTILAMDLQYRGQISIHTPSTGPDLAIRNLFDAMIVLGESEDCPLVATLPIMESELSSRGFDALIGRDILRFCKLTYDGPTETFSLSW